ASAVGPVAPVPRGRCRAVSLRCAGGGLRGRCAFVLRRGGNHRRATSDAGFASGSYPAFAAVNYPEDDGSLPWRAEMSTLGGDFQVPGLPLFQSIGQRSHSGGRCPVGRRVPPECTVLGRTYRDVPVLVSFLLNSRRSILKSDH